MGQTTLTYCRSNTGQPARIELAGNALAPHRRCAIMGGGILYRSMPISRRAFLGTVVGTSLAGCLNQVFGSVSLKTDDGVINEDWDDQPPPTGTVDGPPVASDRLHVPIDPITIRDGILSGGVPQDGIPSIDDPVFGGPTAVDLDANDPVFGVLHGGEARAYPQSILVHHEIVNDEIANDGLAITYCPLTGTAQGFIRNGVEFGVSGLLVNSNLIMYDRVSETRWSQILATGIDGVHWGRSLREIPVTWTSWERWRTVHPDTTVLTTDTGHARDYGNDPYGGYNPRSGYYANDTTMFSPLTTHEDEHPKEVVIGGRTGDGAIAFNKDRLLDEQVLNGTVGAAPVVAVADPELATGYLYLNPDGREVTPVDDMYRVDDTNHEAASLPLNRLIGFDGMWFAWAGFYPDTTYVT